MSADALILFNTDEHGIATVTPVLSERPGAYQLFVRYAGDEERNGTADATGFTVVREDTALNASLRGKGSDRTFVARLSDLDSDSPVAERAVEFYVDGQGIGSGATDSTGQASIAIPPRFRGGHHEFEARFVGDGFYESSSDTVST